MATIKLRFRPSSVKGAMGTLYYRVIHKRGVRWISTGHRIYAEEWDERRSAVAIMADGRRSAELQRIQSALDWELLQRERVLRDMEAENGDFTLDELCDAFDGMASHLTVFAFLQELVARQRRIQRLGTAKTYMTAYQRFREFRAGEDLLFDLLTPDMMEEYEAWLTDRGLKLNTIRFYLRTLSAMLGKAVNERLMSDSRSLFSRVRLSYVKTAKRAISETDMRAIQRLRLARGSIMSFARDIFMFSFYMRGMPFVDIAFLRKTDLKNGMVSYCRRKTHQHLTVAWEREQQEIVGRYAHLTAGTPYMLPIIRRMDGTCYRQYQQMQENVNRALRRIGNMVGLKVPLTTYVARHSWASIARDMNVPIGIISEGMGHQSYKTTQVYLDSIDTSRIDDANRCIIRSISGGKIREIGSWEPAP